MVPQTTERQLKPSFDTRPTPLAANATTGHRCAHRDRRRRSPPSSAQASTAVIARACPRKDRPRHRKRGPPAEGRSRGRHRVIWSRRPASTSGSRARGPGRLRRPTSGSEPDPWPRGLDRGKPASAPAEPARAVPRRAPCGATLDHRHRRTLHHTNMHAPREVHSDPGACDPRVSRAVLYRALVEPYGVRPRG